MAPGSKIHANDLNDIQDSIVNLWSGKHGDRELVVSAADFTVQTGTPDLEAGQWTNATGKINAPLVLPVGTRVKTLIWSYNRNGNGTITLRLIRRQRGGNAPANVDELADSDGAAYETATRTVTHTIASGYQYYLEVELGHATNIFEDVTVTYDAPT
jgi:hypothetical protein